MSLSDVDRRLLQRCLSHQPQAWEDFVDRFIGVVVHVVHHTAASRSIPITKQDEEDLAAEFFLTVVNNDFEVLRRFRGESSLATYLTVIARRVIVRELLKRKSAAKLATGPQQDVAATDTFEERIHNRELVERLMERLSESEAEIVRLYHLEGKSYHEISLQVGIAENSIGPTLSRARTKMRETVADSST